MAEPERIRDDIAAAIAARRELGPEYEDALVESFVERLDRTIEARVDARVAERADEARGDRDDDHGLALAIVSLGTGIPITAIASTNVEGLGGLMVAWAGIAAVNVAYGLGRRRRTR